MGQSRQSGFSSSDVLFDHLARKRRNITVSGHIAQIEGDDQQIAFSASNGADWLALPTKSIKNAEILGGSTLGTKKIRHVQLTLAATSSEADAVNSQLASRPDGDSNVFANLPTTPPPTCPTGRRARWIEDHWECRRPDGSP